MSKISKEVVDLASKISDSIGYNSDTATVEGVEKLYLTYLPEGVTPEHVKLLDDYRATFLPATMMAVGCLGQVCASEGVTGRGIRAVVPIGNCTFAVDYMSETYDRDSKEVPWPVRGEVSYGYSDPTLGMENDEMVSVRDFLKAQALMAFNS